MKSTLDWIPVAIGVVFLSFLTSLQWTRVSRGENDFGALYAGAKLAGTPDLYSRAANQDIIQTTLGVTMESVVYTRAPFYAVLLKPLSWLPYRLAWALFCLSCVGCALWFVIRFQADCAALPLYAAFFIPIAAFIPQGQDTPLLLVFTGVSILQARKGREFVAGLILSLCAIKFHLFLLIPVMLLVKRKWNILAGGVAGTLALFLLGLALAGPGSTAAYVQTLRDPWINFSTDMMPNLHGLASTFGASSPVETSLVVLVVAAFLWLCFRMENYELLFGISLVCGLLVSYHSGLGDQILLLPVFVLLVNSCTSKLMRGVLAISLTPLPYFFGDGISVSLPVVSLVILGLAVASATRLSLPVGGERVVLSEGN